MLFEHLIMRVHTNLNLLEEAETVTKTAQVFPKERTRRNI